MFKKILIALTALITIFVVVVALQPSEFQVTRQVTVNAPPEVPYALVNNFQEWDRWSPWETMDPAMKRTYRSPAAGVGAIYQWTGNDAVGEGTMTITESKAAELVSMRLDFVKPMEATNYTDFRFTPAPDGTTVSWTMSGRKNFISKGFCMFMNMDKMVGGSFEEGLAKLKAQVEGGTVAAVTP